MTFGFRMSCEQTQKLKLQINLKQRIEINFGDFVSRPKAHCPKCHHKLSEKEILKGFSDSPTVFETTCPKCGAKFLANLIITRKDGKVQKSQVIYLCPQQTLYQIKVWQSKRHGKLGVSFLAKNDRQLFYNIIRHFGTYKEGLKAAKKS